jgi:hypothetical protein
VDTLARLAISFTPNNSFSFSIQRFIRRDKYKRCPAIPARESPGVALSSGHKTRNGRAFTVTNAAKAALVADNKTFRRK